MRQKMLALAGLGLLLSSCAKLKLDRVYDEQSRVTYTYVKSAVDLVGGPRQDVLARIALSVRMRGEKG